MMVRESRIESRESKAKGGQSRRRHLTLNAERLMLNASGGFTLVEAMIAAVLIVIGIVGALGAISAGLRAQAAGQFYYTASMLAEQKMADLESQSKLKAGEEQGDFAPDHPDYTWSVAVSEGPEGLWQVRLTVSEVVAGKQGRSAEIETYLLRRES